MILQLPRMSRNIISILFNALNNVAVCITAFNKMVVMSYHLINDTTMHHNTFRSSTVRDNHNWTAASTAPVVRSRDNIALPVVKQSASVVTSRLSHKSSRCSVVIFNSDATFHRNALGAQLWETITAEQPRCRLRAVRTSRLDVHRTGLCQPGFCLEYYSWHWSVSGLRIQTVRLLCMLIIVWLFYICTVLYFSKTNVWLYLFNKRKYV